MKTISKSFFLFFALAGWNISVRAQQNTFPVLSTSVETTCISNCFTLDSFPNTDSSLISVQMTIQLFEVTSIASIQVKLGTTSGGSELLSKTFTFDVSGNVGNGCSYSRVDDIVTLGLSSYIGLTAYFTEVRITKSDASVTDAVVFNR
jgi:hypothetical protein